MSIISPLLAAYNCGPGTINKAIRRAGGATDYWTIYNYLPKETRGYVPAFIDVKRVQKYRIEKIMPGHHELNIPVSLINEIEAMLILAAVVVAERHIGLERLTTERPEDLESASFVGDTK